MYKNSIKNMPQKVCIRKKWSIFVVYLKWARILKKKYQRVQQMLNWFTRGHTNLELCKCRFKFSWISVPCRNKRKEAVPTTDINLWQYGLEEMWMAFINYYIYPRKCVVYPGLY